MSCADAGYFLGLESYNVQQNLTREGIKTPPIFPIAKKGARNITFRFASQVYEADDAGFDLEEITELLDSSKESIQFCKKNRKSISDYITSNLSKALERKVSLPY